MFNRIPWLVPEERRSAARAHNCNIGMKKLDETVSYGIVQLFHTYEILLLRSERCVPCVITGTLPAS